MKRILLANDIAGIGRVALSSAIPVMACSGIETSILPTVLLTSHTGGFPETFVEELPDFTTRALKQWKTIQLHHDALFIGYCRHTKQLDQLAHFCKETNISALFVDPIMGDHGKLYSGFTMEYVHKMKEVVSKATCVFPNLTEAALLTDTAYLGENAPMEAYKQLAKKVATLGAKTVILTGIPYEMSKIGVLAYHRESQSFNTASTTKYPHHFFGTGDLFAAVTTASLLQGKNLSQGISLAMIALDTAIQATLAQKTDLKMGVAFEQALPLLTTLQQKGESS